MGCSVRRAWMNARRRRNREGRGEPPHLNRWRRRLSESMPSPGSAQPGRAAKPRPWPTGEEKRRSTRRGGGSVLRGCRAARRTAYESPPPCGWRAGGRTRDARGATYAIFTTYSPLRATQMPFFTIKHSIQ